MESIEVVLADDHGIVRDGIRSLLESESDIKVVGEAANGLEALNLVTDLHPDILIIDIRMPGMDGISVTKKLTESSSSTKCLILTMHNAEEYVLRSIDSGAYGYLLKDTNKVEFIKAIHTIFKGGRFFSPFVSGVLVDNYLNQKKHPVGAIELTENQIELTKREKEILKHIVEGLSNKDIAEIFHKSVRTVETHRFKIMKKLNVRNVVELINLAKEKSLF
jgi:DNA-binding NarL/FixJ family response regulator